MDKLFGQYIFCAGPGFLNLTQVIGDGNEEGFQRQSKQLTASFIPATWLIACFPSSPESNPSFLPKRK
jgi:hypothetical protein